MMRRFLFLLGPILLAACQPAGQTPAALATQTGPVASSTLPAPAATRTATMTLHPTRTTRPTRTPKPTPTLPALAVLSCIPAEAERASAVVAGVIDGDTIEVLIGLLSFRVRYLGIDTPETNITPAERLGPEATARNRELVSGKRIVLVADPEADDQDRYGRLLRYVIVDDIFVNYQLVREGLARYYASEFACGATIFQAEQASRAERSGLWAP